MYRSRRSHRQAPGGPLVRSTRERPRTRHFSLRRRRGAHLILLKADEAGELVPAWQGWNRRRPGSGQCIDHVRAGGRIGWMPSSFECIVIDVDHGDPRDLASVHPPLVYLETRRGAHLVYRRNTIDVIDGVAFEWAGVSGEIKSTGMCRLHGNGAEKLAFALATSNPDDRPFPEALLRPGDYRQARKRKRNRKTGKARLSAVRNPGDVYEGVRNETLFETGRHSVYRMAYDNYAELEAKCTALAYAISESFECEQERGCKIDATAKSWARYKWKWDTGQCAPQRASKRSQKVRNNQIPACPPPSPKTSVGGMMEAHGTAARDTRWDQRRRSWGGKVRAKRVHEKNYQRDCKIWRWHDEGRSIRRIEAQPSINIKRNAIHNVIKRRPAGQGKMDEKLRGLAHFYRKRPGAKRSSPHLTRIAKQVKLPSKVVRAWLALPPAPDYVNEHAARLAAKLATKPRDKRVTELRRTLRKDPGQGQAELEVRFPDIEPRVIEEQVARQRKIDTRTRWWYERTKMREEGTEAGTAPSRSTAQEKGASKRQHELEIWQSVP